MKKVLTILLAFMYLSISTGVVYNVHYCMGEIANIALGSNTGEKCATCGMDNKGCCHDDIQVVKLKDDHSPSAIQFSLIKYTAIPLERMAWVANSHFISQYVKIHLNHDPPDNLDRNIMNSVFRI